MKFPFGPELGVGSGGMVTEGAGFGPELDIGTGDMVSEGAGFGPEIWKNSKLNHADEFKKQQCMSLPRERLLLRTAECKTSNIAYLRIDLFYKDHAYLIDVVVS